MLQETVNLTQKSNDLTPLDRRREARFPFTATVEVIEPKSKTRIQGRTSDLSRGGCYIDTISSFPFDTNVNVILKKENRAFEAQAKVAYSLDGMGMGLKFVQAAPEQMNLLNKWVGVLSGELAHEPEVEEAVEQPVVEVPSKRDPLFVMNELIVELMRQGVLPETKCKALLQQLSGSDPDASNILATGLAQ